MPQRRNDRRVLLSALSEKENVFFIFKTNQKTSVLAHQAAEYGLLR
jgi:hypothetical protein